MTPHTPKGVMGERGEKVAEAQKLREQGLTYREIGERLGMSLWTVYRWLNPD